MPITTRGRDGRRVRRKFASRDRSQNVQIATGFRTARTREQPAAGDGTLELCDDIVVTNRVLQRGEAGIAPSSQVPSRTRRRGRTSTSRQLIVSRDAGTHSMQRIAADSTRGLP